MKKLTILLVMVLTLILATGLVAGCDNENTNGSTNGYANDFRDYSDEIESGRLVYNKYDYRDPDLQHKRDEFNAPKFSLFITTHHGEETERWTVNRIWLYTDTTGTNETLRERFFNEMYKNLDQALEGEPDNGGAGPADLVEVDFFYESDNCFCLDLAVDWVDKIITGEK